MNAKTIKKVVMIPIALILGYVFSSLLLLDKVKYFNLDGKGILFYALTIVLTAIIYALIYFLLFTQKGKRLSKIFKLFDKEDEKDILCAVFALVVGVAIFILIVYGLFLPIKCDDCNDYKIHANWAIAFDFTNIPLSFRYRTYPIWHILVGFFNKVFYIPKEYSAGLTSAIFVMLSFLLVRKIFLFLAREVKKSKSKLILIDLFALVLMFVQSIYLPFFNKTQFFGQGGAHTWHNPTNTAVQPLALLCVVLFIDYIVGGGFVVKNESDIKNAKLIRLTVFLTLSVLAKPSFAQVFFPAVAIYYAYKLITTKGKCFKETVGFLVACILPMIFVLLSYVFNYFDTNDSHGIMISFAGVWKTKSDFIPLSIFIAIAFPIVFTALNFKDEIKKPEISLTWIIVLVGILEYLLLAEKGIRFNHDNFMWGYDLSQFMIFVFTTGNALLMFFDILEKPTIESGDALLKYNKAKRIKLIKLTISFVFLALHLLSGIRYYKNIMVTNYHG